jgi:DNA-binding CsgD family transcriptional regulator
MKENNEKSKRSMQIRNSTAEFLIFTLQSNENTIEVLVEDETVWLTQKLIAELFGVEVNTINYHLKEIFKSGELNEEAVIRKNRITASDGKSYNTNFYNLDAIISVGYRVNSLRATQFRQWATGVLRNFAIRGYVLDSTAEETSPITVKPNLCQLTNFFSPSRMDFLSSTISTLNITFLLLLLSLFYLKVYGQLHIPTPLSSISINISLTLI